MSTHLVGRTSLLCTLVAVLAVHSLSQDQSGGLAGAPFRLGDGARSMGMGNAMSAIPFGNVSAISNPALVPFESKRVATAAFGLLTLDRRLNIAGYTQTLPPTAGLSLLLINAGVGAIDGRDRDGLHTEDYSTSENEALFSFGVKLANDFSIGMGVKVLYYKLFEGVKSTTVGFDVGVLYLLNADVTLSASILDLNSKYKWDTSGLYGLQGTTTTDFFPTRKRLGVCFSPGEHTFLVTGECELMSSQTFLRAGAEIEVLDGLSVRGGVDQISVTGVVNAKPAVGFSLGKPVGNWEPVIEYTYVFEPYAPSGFHVIALSVRFE